VRLVEANGGESVVLTLGPPEAVEQLRAYLDGFWSDRLGALKTAAEREARRKRS